MMTMMSNGIAATLLLVCFAVQTTNVATLSVSALSGDGDYQRNSSTSIRSGNKTTSGQSSSPKSNSSDVANNSSSTGGSLKKHSSGGGGSGNKSAKFISLDGDVGFGHLPIGYRYKYASNYDSYVSSSYGSSSSSSLGLGLGLGLDLIDLDTDTDIDFHEPIWFPLHYDVDLDLDLDFDDVDLDLDLLKLKYGLYGLNHYSLRNPHFNEYHFRRRYRSSSRSRPYFRPHHRYMPRYWKHDLEFWGLDNYGLGFGYDKYVYLNSLSLSTPISYSHVSTFF